MLPFIFLPLYVSLNEGILFKLIIIDINYIYLSSSIHTYVSFAVSISVSPTRYILSFFPSFSCSFATHPFPNNPYLYLDTVNKEVFA